MTLKEKKKAHLKTIKVHRREVRKWCFKMGIPLQGILHDLSKYSKEELEIYKYYDGTKSPHDIARKRLGYSPSWLYHKARNKHHWEYWTDSNSAVAIDDKIYMPIVAMKMPYKYAIEMFCDYIGAGKAYMKDKWTPDAPFDYFVKTSVSKAYHNETYALLYTLFRKLKKLGEKRFLEYYKKNKKQIKELYNTEDGIYEIRYESPIEPLYSSDE